MKKRRWKKPRPSGESLRESFARTMEEIHMPAGALLGLPELQCSERGVLEYSSERIRVAAKDVTVQICGMDLELEAMSAGELNIRGKIASVEFIR